MASSNDLRLIDNYRITLLYAEYSPDTEIAPFLQLFCGKIYANVLVLISFVQKSWLEGEKFAE